MGKVAVNEQALRRYIEKCITDACQTCERESDVEYDYRIIDKYLLFAIKTKYRRVRVRILYRLLHNLPKNFGLEFQAVHPWIMHESPECWDSLLFDVSGDILNVRNSIGYWSIFGIPCAICFRYESLHRVCPTDISDSAYCDLLRANGYVCDDEDQSANSQPWAKTFEEDWVRYKLAFKEAFGITPEERGLQVATTMKAPPSMRPTW